MAHAQLPNTVWCAVGLSVARASRFLFIHAGYAAFRLTRSGK
jgi:hypothetical protein